MPDDRKSIWEGVYGTFSEAKADASIFDEGIWLSKVTERARAALEASNIVAAVSPVAETRDYVLPIVSAMTAKAGSALRILDFGGGLATSFVPLEKMLPDGQPLDFVIMENEAVCALGRELFSGDNRVSFVSELPTAGETFDVVHCGSSLHYVDDWRGTLRKFVEYKPQVIVISDLPAAENATFVTAQSFHGKRIPVRFWNLDAFVSTVSELGYELAFKARYRNIALDLNLEAAMRNFDDAHRLEYFVQLIFRPHK